MRDLRTIAWREFRETALTPAFLISLIAMPLVLVVVAVLSSGLALTHTEPPVSGTIWIQSSEEFRIAFTERLKLGVDAESVGDLPSVTVNFEGEVAAGPRTDPPNGSNPVMAKIPESLLSPDNLEGEILLTLHDALGRPQVDAVETALADTVVTLRQRRAEVDPTLIDRLRTPPTITTTRLDDQGLTAEDSQSRKLRALVIPMGLMFLLWGASFGTSAQLMQTTLDEKANKVVEVLLSTTSPERLMMGKILGQSGVALTTVGIYGGLGISALIAAGKVGLILDPQLLWPLAWFALAFLGAAAILAAVGAVVHDQREAGNLMGPIVALLGVPVFFIMPIAQAPHGMPASIASFAPVIGPYIMAMRSAGEIPVPYWQLGVGLVWHTAIARTLLVGAGRVFRVGILSSGTPPKFTTLLRWLIRP